MLRSASRAAPQTLLLALLLCGSALPALSQASGSGKVSSTAPAATETVPAPAAPREPAIAAQNPPADPAKPNPLAPLLQGLLKGRTDRPAEPPTTPPAVVEEPKVEPPVVEAPEPPRAPEPPAIAESPGEAPEGFFTTISPNRLADILRPLVDEVSVDASGSDTTLEGRLDGTDFQAYFYECDGGDMASEASPDSDCFGYELRAYFPDYPTDTDRVNQWNADNHYGKLWVDSDGDLAVQLNVIVEGGATEATVGTTVAWFRAILEGVHGFYR